MSQPHENTNAAVDTERGAIVVSIAGDIDTTREEEILDAVVALDAPRGTTLELELSEVSFVDSRGLTTLLRIKAYLDARGCTLRLVQPQKQLIRMVDLTGLGDVLVLDA